VTQDDAKQGRTPAKGHLDVDEDDPGPAISSRAELSEGSQAGSATVRTFRFEGAALRVTRRRSTAIIRCRSFAQAAAREASRKTEGRRRPFSDELDPGWQRTILFEGRPPTTSGEVDVGQAVDEGQVVQAFAEQRQARPARG